MSLRVCLSVCPVCLFVCVCVFSCLSVCLSPSVAWASVAFPEMNPLFPPRFQMWCSDWMTAASRPTSPCSSPAATGWLPCSVGLSWKATSRRCVQTFWMRQHEDRVNLKKGLLSRSWLLNFNAFRKLTAVNLVSPSVPT